MFELIYALISDYGYISLFITSFLASTVLPFGSEGVTALLVYSGFDLFTVVMIATVGNYLGACTTYYIGLKGRTGIIDKYLSISQDQITKTDKLFEKYGVYTLLFTWVPGIGDVITAAGGLLKLPFKTFSIYVFVGKFARYFVVAYLAAKL
ncbi:MAG TPA: DedA family protein [Methanosarcinaceae archaeon]|nr:DedA family protein [Methanosarcinaceae archaeon]